MTTTDRDGSYDDVSTEAVEPETSMPIAPRRATVCPTRTPEPHDLGEFPMTCYRCHVEADS